MRGNNFIVLNLVASISIGVIPIRAAEHPDLGKLTQYSESDRLWFSTVLGDVVINPQTPIEVNVVGDIKWLAKKGEVVESGEAICELGADEIDLSSRDIELRSARLSNSINDVEWAYQEKVQSLQKSIGDLQEQILELQLSPTERAIIDPEIFEELKKERTKLEKALSIKKERLDGDYFEQFKRSEIEALQLEIDQAKLTHKNLVSKSTIYAETDGRLDIRVNNVEKIPKEIGEVIGINVAEVSIELTDPRSRNVPSEEMTITLVGDDGETYDGKFLREEKSRLSRLSSLNLVFQLKINGDTDPDSLNGKRMVRIFQNLEQQAFIVPKNDLLFRFPKEIGKNGWPDFISSRWPGAKILKIGPKELAVVESNED